MDEHPPLSLTLIILAVALLSLIVFIGGHP